MKNILCAALAVITGTVAAEHRWDFEGLVNGDLPKGWKVESTGEGVPLGAWQSVGDTSSPCDGSGVLRLADTRHNINQGFNICWTDMVEFKEGEISVWLKGNSGERDQGGGPIWRVQDRNNYYIARYNPLEKNVSVYHTEEGRRITLAYSGTLQVKDGWNHLKITHSGNMIRVFLNEKMVLRVNDGGCISASGGVGLWTKSDAATLFDDFTIIPE